MAQNLHNFCTLIEIFLYSLEVTIEDYVQKVLKHVTHFKAA